YRRGAQGQRLGEFLLGRKQALGEPAAEHRAGLERRQVFPERVLAVHLERMNLELGGGAVEDREYRKAAGDFGVELAAGQQSPMAGNHLKFTLGVTLDRFHLDREFLAV